MMYPHPAQWPTGRLTGRIESIPLLACAFLSKVAANLHALHGERP